jgi:hypothetical protein
MGTRRAFIRQTTAAVALAGLFRPTVLLRESIDREAILKKFCERYPLNTRYAIAEPFSVDSLTYATDGRWMIRAELAAPIDAGEPKRRPPVHEVFDRWDHSRAMREMESPTDSDLLWGSGLACPHCQDKRVDVSDDWERYADALDFDGDDCTIGDRNCPVCWDPVLNRGRGAYPCMVKIGGYHFEAVRVREILAIPGMRVGAAPAWFENRRVGVLQFEGNGFQGIMAGVDAYAPPGYRGPDYSGPV